MAVQHTRVVFAGSVCFDSPTIEVRKTRRDVIRKSVRKEEEGAQVEPAANLSCRSTHANIAEDN